MKFLEKVGLIVFANIILILSVLLVIILAGWMDAGVIEILIMGITGTTWATITVVVSIMLIALAIRCIFFTEFGEKDEGKKDGIILQNESGKLLISRETIENIVNGVVKGFDGAKDVVSKIVLDSENNVIVYVTLFILSDIVIKDLSNNIQLRVKEAIKKSSDLDVKEVNVRIRNVYPKKIEE